MKVFDGHNAVLGRLAAITAKNLINGEEIAIINCEKIIVTGNPRSIVSKYLKMRRLGSPPRSREKSGMRRIPRRFSF